MLNSDAFFCSFANLFSYLETFFRVGLMNFPRRSFTAMLSSLISNFFFIFFRLYPPHDIVIFLAYNSQFLFVHVQCLGLATPLVNHLPPLSCF